MEETPVEATAKYVHGVTWPASKAEVIEALERNRAPQDIIETIRVYDHEKFASPADVHGALWLQA